MQPELAVPHTHPITATAEGHRSAMTYTLLEHETCKPGLAAQPLHPTNVTGTALESRFPAGDGMPHMHHELAVRLLHPDQTTGKY